MPVITNITGVWRLVKLVNLTNIGSSVDPTGTLKGDKSSALSNRYLVLERAEFDNTMDVTPMTLTQGTAKTKVLDIKNVTDTLHVTGPMLLASRNLTPDTASSVPYPLALASTSFGDASTVAVAYLEGALNPTDGQTSYAESIKLSIDENGASFDINIKGDPTSLYPNFASSTNSVVPFGNATGVPPLPSALRKAQWYDFYVEADITMAVDGTPTFATAHAVGAIKSMSYNFQIGAEQYNLVGRGQAPWFSINKIALTASMTLVFPLMTITAGDYTKFKTPLSTAQNLPGAWGTGSGPKFGDSDPTTTGSGKFPERPDMFTVDTISLSPKYKANGLDLLDPTLFGLGVDGKVSGVISKSKVSLSGQLITSDIEFQVVF